MGVFGGSPGARYFRRGRPRALPPRRGWCRGARARRFRRAARRLRSTRTQRRRRGAADAPLPSESVGGVFGMAWAPPGALRGAGAHCWRGRRFFGLVGCPLGILYIISLSSRPVAVVSRPDRSVARPRRAFHCAARGGLSLPCCSHFGIGILAVLAARPGSAPITTAQTS